MDKSDCAVNTGADDDKQELLTMLKDMFKGAVENDVIEDVAEICHWDSSRSIEALLDVTGNFTPYNCNENGVTSASDSSVSLISNMDLNSIPQVSNTRLPDDDADVVIEEEGEYEIINNNGRYYDMNTPFYSVSNVFSIPSQLNADTFNSQCYSQKLTTNVGPACEDNHSRNQIIMSEASCSSNMRQPAVKEKGSPSNEALDRIIKYVNEKTRVMVLMRGCPGSGKTHLARNIINSTLVGKCSDYIFSTDDYFVQYRGMYVYKKSELSSAHEWNKMRVKEKVFKGWSPIFIDNTNTEVWEMYPYLELAVRFGYAVEILEPFTPWKVNAKELSNKNIHGVPLKTITSMLDRFHKFSNSQQLLNACKLKYSSRRPPQPAFNIYKTLAEAQSKTPKKQRSKKSAKIRSASSESGNLYEASLRNITQLENNNPPQSEYVLNACSGNGVLNSNTENVVYMLEPFPINQKEKHTDTNQQNLINFSDEDCSKTFQSVVSYDSCKNKSKSLSSLENVNCTESLAAASENSFQCLSSHVSSPFESFKSIKKNSQENDMMMKTDSNNSFRFQPHQSSIYSHFEDKKSESSEIFSDFSPQCISRFNSESTDVMKNSPQEFSEPENNIHTKEEVVNSNDVNSEVNCGQDNAQTSHTNLVVTEDEMEQWLSSLEENRDNNFDNLRSLRYSTSNQGEKDIDMSLFSDNLKEIPKENLFVLLGQASDESSGDSAERNMPSSSETNSDMSLNNNVITGNVSDTDLLLKHWENGSTWDGQRYEHISSKINMHSSTPKPERKLRRERVKVSVMQEAEEETELEQEDGSWATVSDPVSSWDDSGSSKDGKQIEESENSGPQPQRAIFVTNQKSLEKAETNNQNHLLDKPCQSELLNADASHVKDASTTTVSRDFIILDHVNAGSEVDTIAFDVTLIHAKYTNGINSSINYTTSAHSFIPRILMLDKGSMTDDNYDSSASDKKLSFRQKLQRLLKHFPDGDDEVIQDILQKCNGDLNWAANILIESNYRIQDLISDSDLVSSDEDLNNDVDDKEDMPINVSVTEDNMAFSDANKNERNTAEQKTEYENNLQLKKEIEQKFNIRDSHYSDHVLRIKKFRRGDRGNFDSIVNDFTGSNEADGLHHVNVIPSFEVNSLRSNEVQEFHVDENFRSSTSDDSVEIDEHIALGADRRQATDDFDDADEETVSSEEEVTVPVTLDRNSVNRLQALFGNSAFTFPSDLTPELNVPLSVARLLYCALIDVRETHYQKIADQDEKLARELQEEERQSGGQSCSAAAQQNNVTLTEIMDSELALHLHKHDQDKWKSEIKYDMASKLTLIKLISEFPKVDKDTICEIFHSYGNSYEETRNVLLMSTAEEDSGNPKTVFSTESLLAYEAQLLEQAKKNQVESAYAIEPPENMTVPTNPVEENMHYFKHYRNIANQYRDEQAQCQEKAKQMYRQGYIQAGSYYLQEVSQLKEKIDAANNAAVTHLITANNLRSNNTTLDLHCLYVSEALQVLDIFLDTHITRLREQGRRLINIFVITGYGSRSLGKPRIKPAAMQRLEQRYLKFKCHKSNPGLLDVVVRKNSFLSSDIQKKV